MITNYFCQFAKISAAGLLAVAPLAARATLTYENVNGVGLVYDSVTGLNWTQDGNATAPSLDWQDAQTWAAGLAVAGIAAGNWQVPNAAQFTSLYSQLEGTDHKYGTQVDFGTGPNDFASNVSPVYWTDASTTDFNFYYGYSGYDPADSDQYSVWAVTAVPEPSSVALGLMGLTVAGGIRWRRNQVRA